MIQAEFEKVKNDLQLLRIYTIDYLVKIENELKKIKNNNKIVLEPLNKMINNYEDAVEGILYSSTAEQKKKYQASFKKCEKIVNSHDAFNKVNYYKEINQNVINYYINIYNKLLKIVSFKLLNIIFKYCNTKRDYTQICNFVNDAGYKYCVFDYYLKDNQFKVYFSCNDFYDIDNDILKELKIDLSQLHCYTYMDHLMETDSSWNDILTDASFKAYKENTFKPYEYNDNINIIDFETAFKNACEVYDLKQAHETELKALIEKHETELKTLNLLYVNND